LPRLRITLASNTLPASFTQREFVYFKAKRDTAAPRGYDRH